MILEFEDEKGLLDEQARGLMQLCADAAQRTEGVSCPLSVFISVVGDEQIREINREQRGKDAATDVLSFPTVNYPKGKTAGQCEPLLREEYDPDTDACALGDIVISKEKVLSQAEEFGHSALREYAFLIVHSVLHLIGYDHMQDEERQIMERKQKEIMERLNILR